MKKNLKPLSFVDVNQNDYVMALLGIYERNDISLLRDFYVWAYQRSSQRYSALQQTMGQPNLFKLQHRDMIHHIVKTIVLEKISGSKIVSKIKLLIQEFALPEQESMQLFQIIEIEIMGLHEGNIARYKIRPGEFQQWKKRY